MASAVARTNDSVSQQPVVTYLSKSTLEIADKIAKFADNRIQIACGADTFYIERREVAEENSQDDEKSNTKQYTYHIKDRNDLQIAVIRLLKENPNFLESVDVWNPELQTMETLQPLD